MEKGIKEGRDKYKYDKIYSREGHFTKGGQTFSWNEADPSLKRLWSQYGHSIEGSAYLNEVLHVRPRSVLDVGCGHNEFCGLLKKHGIKNSIGLDCSCHSADILASAHDMPIDDDSFDLLVSFDCMEHIPEDEVPLVFEEFKRVSKRLFIKIALTQTPTRIDGEVLHACIKTPDWWLDQCKKHFNLVGVLFKQGLSWSSQYIVIQAVNKNIPDLGESLYRDIPR